MIPPGRVPASAVSALAEGLRDRALGVALPAASGRGVVEPCPARGVTVTPSGGGGGDTHLAGAGPCGPAGQAHLALEQGQRHQEVRGNFRRPDISAPLLGGIGAIVVVALHSTVDFSLEIQAVAVAFVAILAIAFAQSFPQKPEEL